MLMANMLFVLLAYSYNSINNQISSNVTFAKQLFILISILHILFYRIPLNRLKNLCLYMPAAMIGIALLNISFLDTFSRTFTFLVPYFYIYLALNHLLARFRFETILVSVICSINIIYFYPVLIYFLFDSGFGRTNIYGIREDSFFYSNHYGWSGTLFICSLPVAIQHIGKNRLFRYLLLIGLIQAIYLVIISANRSSLASCAVGLLFFILANRDRSWLQRKEIRFLPLILLIPIVFFLQIKDEKGSAISFLKAKNEKQFETKQIPESRIIVTNYAFRRFTDEPLLWLTGVGIFNHGLIRGVSNLEGYHNSYWEVLFGCGVPVFILFCILMVFNPLKLLIRRLGGNYILIIPLIIIPFFESNITGGQFVFFPWFIMMLLFNTKLKNGITKTPFPSLKGKNFKATSNQILQTGVSNAP